MIYIYLYHKYDDLFIIFCKYIYIYEIIYIYIFKFLIKKQKRNIIFAFVNIKILYCNKKKICKYNQEPFRNNEKHTFKIYRFFIIIYILHIFIYRYIDNIYKKKILDLHIKIYNSEKQLKTPYFVIC